MEISHIFKSRLISVILLALSIFLIETSAIANTVQKKEKKQVFTDEDLQVEKIGGKGTISTLPDIKQVHDYSVPVVVTYINTLYGQGKHAGRVKILEAKIENRVQKLTQSIQLRWLIVTHEDPANVLLEGVTPFLEAQIETNRASLVDIPPIYFNKIIKPLLKEGELNGNLKLVVGIQEARFADGTAWRRTQQGAFLRAASADSSLDLKH